MVPQRPNILLIFPDQHRGDWLHDAKTGVRMPHLDALARSGMVYRTAITPSPICSPARACFATGRKYDSQHVQKNSHDLDPNTPNLYQALQDVGYWTMACGKFDLLKASKDWGSDGRHVLEDGRCLLSELGFSDGVDNAGKRDFVTAWGLGHSEPYREFLSTQGLLQAHLDDFMERPHRQHHSYTNTTPTPLPDSAYCDNWIAGNGLKLLNRAPVDRPWFLQVNFNGPHEPVDVTERMWQDWRGVNLPPPHGEVDLPLPVHNEIRRNYAAMLENIDRHIATFVSHLERSGQINSTIIVYSSDHGDMLGDRNRFDKMVPYEPAIRIPLVIRGPGIKPGSTQRPVSLIDLTASMIEWSHGDLHGVQGVPLGRSSRELRATRSITTGLACWRAIRGQQYKYIHNFREDMSWSEMASTEWDPSTDAPCVLYDLLADPNEQTNIAPTSRDRCKLMYNDLLASVEAA